MYEAVEDNDALPTTVGGARRSVALKPRAALDENGERLAAPNLVQRRRRSARADLHPLRTCLIVGLPWFAYSIFSVFEIFFLLMNTLLVLAHSYERFFSIQCQTRCSRT